VNFMDRLPRPKAIANYGPTDDRSYTPGGSYYGGVPIPSLSGTPESALRQMTVNNCVRVLYNCVSQTPFHIMEEVDDVRNKAKDFYLYKLIGKRPNSWMTSPQFFGMAIVHLCLRGNFYAYKSRVGNKILALLPIAPDRVQVKQEDDWSLTYRVSTSKGPIDYTQADIFHIRGLSYDGIVGINPIEYARQCVYNGQSSETFIGNYFSNGMIPGALIETDKPWSLETRKNLGTALREEYVGISNANNRGLMILDDGMKIKFPEIKLVDQQFIEQQRFTESQIAGMFGVPLILIQAGATPATYASSTEFKRNFVDMTLTPIAVNFETTIDRDCLTDSEQDRYYTKGNLNSLLRGNTTERYAAYQVGVNAEILSPNECRNWEDLNPYEGGDEYRSRTSTIKESDKVKEDDKSTDKEDDGDDDAADSSNGGK
jgi:HK97 family phage portal protein